MIAMGEKNVMLEKFREFIGGLSEAECRDQLALAYMQMELCQSVLRGEEVEPVEMKDNGESSDLELFYQCKKAAEEIVYLNEQMSKKDGEKD